MEEEKIKAATQVNQLMNSLGLTVSELISFTGKQDSKLLNLSADKQKQFMELYDKLESGRYTDHVKGALLEQLTDILFNKSLFRTMKNCRTSTNELDILVEWTDEARLANIHKAFPNFGNIFICECKNYTKTVSVTYVGKFISLLITSNISLGIMVAWHGVTGRSAWSDSKGLIKKIALSRGIFIIVIEQSDLKKLYNQETNIFALVHDKYNALKMDIDYTRWIANHEAEGTLVKKRNL